MRTGFLDPGAFAGPNADESVVRAVFACRLPVVTGVVMIVGADGVPHYGAITPDGTYRVQGVPVGSARVTRNGPAPITFALSEASGRIV